MSLFGFSFFRKNKEEDTFSIVPPSEQDGATVIDVGITRTDQGLVGDVDPTVAQSASAFAPMPGGVGPMTRAMLLNNIIELAKS